MNEQEYMLTDLLNCQRHELYLDSKSLTDEQYHQFQDMRDRRALDEPLQYILGYCDFMGMKLKVDKRVFIPRPETEILVEAALQEIREILDKHHRYVFSGLMVKSDEPLKILDLGTGSGNIAIGLVKNLEDCLVDAIDISGEAITLAQENARNHSVEEKINFIQSNLVSYFKMPVSQQGQYDFIISNPPYIKTKELHVLPRDVQWEPMIALDGGKDGLDFYRYIIEGVHRFLKKDGMILLEVGDEQAPLVEKIFKKNPPYKNFQIVKDYMNTDRILMAQKS